jgi:tetratricopeptide (TPR) repeat protein
MGEHLARASLLVDRRRYDLAETELMAELASDPDSSTAHALLAVCLGERGDLERATDEARRAIAAGPDDALAHRAHAHVLRKRNRFDEALQAAEEAVRLEPANASNHALVGSIQLARSRWSEALDAAGRGLAEDPGSLECTNIRATALVQLGRRAEANATLQGALARDPARPETHANRGWALLHEGDAAKALEHFREALRLDPTNAFARAGIVEALKARYWIYALILGYFLWMSRLGAQTRWGIVVGGYIGYRALLSVAESNPGLGPWIWPILAAYIAFAVMTWIAGPLFSLVLRLNRFGRLALSREQTVASSWIGAFLALTVACALVAIFAKGDVSALGLIAALTFGPAVIPLSGTFACPRGWPRTVMALVTGGLVLGRLGALAVAFEAHDQAVANAAIEWSTPIFFYGVLGSQFLANGLAGVAVKK